MGASKADIKHGITRGLTVGLLSVVPLVALLILRHGGEFSVPLMLRGVALSFGGALAVGVGVNVERLEPIWRAITGALLAVLAYRILFGGYPWPETIVLSAWGALGGMILGAPQRP